MDINVFLLCFNESALLPHTIKHYKKYLPSCKITIYDNQSTDNSVEIAKLFGCSVISWNSNNIQNEFIHINLRNEVWRNIKSGWVIMADMDEFLCVSEDELLKELNLGRTILQVEGLDMIGESETTELLDIDLQEIKKYNYNPNESKNLCFLREAIIDMNYEAGAHYCRPTGFIMYSSNVYINKHMNYLGLNFLINKLTTRYERNQEMIQIGCNGHYTNDLTEIEKRYTTQINNCKTLY